MTSPDPMAATLTDRQQELREVMRNEHLYYPDLPCWCGGIPAFGVPHTDVFVTGDPDA